GGPARGGRRPADGQGRGRAGGLDRGARARRRRRGARAAARPGRGPVPLSDAPRASLRAMTRVLFVHGQESGPQGTKARLLARHFETLTPQMDTGDFAGCVRQIAAAIESFQPDVVVGSSFGGAVAVALLQRGAWRGPTLLLAPAPVQLGLEPRLPTGVPVWIVHGTEDDVVPIASSLILARSGSPERVRLLEVHDDHRLSATVASGRLLALLRALAADVGAPLPSAGERHLRVLCEEPAPGPVPA